MRFFPLQPAEAQSYKLLSASCKALRDSSKHQEILARGIHPAFMLPAFWRPPVLQRHPWALFTIRDQAATAGRLSLAQPSARVSQPFAQRLRIPEMTRHKHIFCACILEHFLQLGNESKSTLEAYIYCHSQLKKKKKTNWFFLFVVFFFVSLSEQKCSGRAKGELHGFSFLRDNVLWGKISHGGRLFSQPLEKPTSTTGSHLVIISNYCFLFAELQTCGKVSGS